MKKILLVIAGAVCFTAAQAQFKVGVKGGLNIANFGGKDVPDNAKSKTGFHGGAFAQYGLNEQFAVQAELIYSAQGSKGSIEGDPGYVFEVKDDFNYFNIPVLFQYKHKTGLFAETGPQIGVLLSAKEKTDGHSEDVKEEIKKTDLSWTLGIGYLSKYNVGINARYNLGLSKMPKEEFEGYTKVFNRVFQVSLFYVFDLSKL